MFRPSACASAGTYYSVSQLAFFRIFSLCSCQGAGCFFQGLNPENDTADSAFLFQALSFNSFPLTLCVFARPALWPSRSHSHASAASAAPLTNEFFAFAFPHSHRPWNELPAFAFRCLPRKEVIQPHLPIRLPCYDFNPVIGLTFDSWLLSVTSLASGAPNSPGVTGGVYKARERIHRGMLIRDY